MHSYQLSPLSPSHPLIIPNVSSPTIVTSKGHSFLVRALQSSDSPFITELARYTYEGRDFITTDFPNWINSTALHPPLPIGIIYLGPLSPSSPSSPSINGDANELSSYLNHVIAIEVVLFLDDGATAWLYALRVHPVFRSLSLSSMLHAGMIYAALDRPGVQRVRECTNNNNNISLYLARKNGFYPIFEQLYYWVYYEDWHSKVDALERKMKRRGMDLAQARMRGEGRGGLMATGTAEDVLHVQSQHSRNPTFAYLCLYWIAYEFSPSNVIRLTTDPDLKHEVTVSYDSTSSSNPVAFTLTRFSSDFSSPTQTFTVYAADVRHLFLHLHFALQRQAAHVQGNHYSDDDENKRRYARPMALVPVCFKKDLHDDDGDENGEERHEGAGSVADAAWQPNMHLIMLERNAETVVRK